MFKLLIRAILVVGCFVALIVFGVRSCSSHEYPLPSEAYYVSDYAGVLHPATSEFIVNESEALYESTQGIDDIGGTQIVFATFEVESVGDIAEYDKNDLFREWEIGKNDMGVLVILFFTSEEVDEIKTFNLRQMQIEVGDSQLSFYTPTLLNHIYGNTLETHFPPDSVGYAYDWDLALGVGSLMNELLNVAYGDIYHDPDNVIPQSEFDPWFRDDYLENYTYSSDLNTTDEISLLAYFLSFGGWSADKTLFWAFAALTILAGGFGMLKAGGGSSSGGGLFKRR